MPTVEPSIAYRNLDSSPALEEQVRRRFADQMVLGHIYNHQGSPEAARELAYTSLHEHLRWTRARTERVELPEELKPLWQDLRDCRKRIAEQQGIAPFMVFHDATLRLMAQLQPLTHNELLGISGVGQSKLNNYGDAFLAVIREHIHGAVPS